MPNESRGRLDLAKEEWSLFLAECWKRNEAPADEAWKRHLRLAAHEYLRHAHDLLAYSADPEWEADTEDEAADQLIAWLNGGGATFRMSGSPAVPISDVFADEDIRAWDEHIEALRTMPYTEYLLTPEWAERRRGALQRAGHACQTCGGHGRLHVHHRTYERRGQESVDDLIVLCEECHLAVHVSGGSHLPRSLA